MTKELQIIFKLQDDRDKNYKDEDIRWKLGYVQALLDFIKENEKNDISK